MLKYNLHGLTRLCNGALKYFLQFVWYGNTTDSMEKERLLTCNTNWEVYVADVFCCQDKTYKKFMCFLLRLRYNEIIRFA